MVVLSESVRILVGALDQAERQGVEERAERVEKNVMITGLEELEKCIDKLQVQLGIECSERKKTYGDEEKDDHECTLWDGTSLVIGLTSQEEQSSQADLQVNKKRQSSNTSQQKGTLQKNSPLRRTDQ